MLFELAVLVVVVVVVVDLTVEAGVAVDTSMFVERRILLLLLAPQQPKLTTDAELK